VGQMKIVPGGLETMTVKRPLRIVACVDNRAIRVLYGDSVGLEHRPSLLTDYVHLQQLLRGVDDETNVLEGMTVAALLFMSQRAPVTRRRR
jgi:hypothetical protein